MDTAAWTADVSEMIELACRAGPDTQRTAYRWTPQPFLWGGGGGGAAFFGSGSFFRLTFSVTGPFAAGAT